MTKTSMTSRSTDSWLSPQSWEHPLVHGWRWDAHSCSDHHGSLSNLVSIYIDTRGTQTMPQEGTRRFHCLEQGRGSLPSDMAITCNVDRRTQTETRKRTATSTVTLPEIGTSRDYNNSELRLLHWTLPSCKQRQHQTVLTTLVSQAFLDPHAILATVSRTALQACSLLTWLRTHVLMQTWQDRVNRCCVPPSFFVHFALVRPSDVHRRTTLLYLEQTKEEYYRQLSIAFREAWRDHCFPAPFSWFLHETSFESLKITSARCFSLKRQRKDSKKKSERTTSVSWRPWARAYSRDRVYNFAYWSAMSNKRPSLQFFSRIYGVICRVRAFCDQQWQFLTRNKSLRSENEWNYWMTSECVRTDSILPRAGREHGRCKQSIFSL